MAVSACAQARLHQRTGVGGGSEPHTLCPASTLCCRLGCSPHLAVDVELPAGGHLAHALAQAAQRQVERARHRAILWAAQKAPSAPAPGSQVHPTHCTASRADRGHLLARSPPCRLHPSPPLTRLSSCASRTSISAALVSPTTLSQSISSCTHTHSSGLAGWGKVAEWQERPGQSRATAGGHCAGKAGRWQGQEGAASPSWCTTHRRARCWPPPFLRGGQAGACSIDASRSSSSEKVVTGTGPLQAQHLCTPKTRHHHHHHQPSPAHPQAPHPQC